LATATVAAFVLAVAVLTLWRLGREAVSWLADQPEYQARFSEIVLENPPPNWFKGGSPAFLERVRHLAGWSESISMIETTPIRVRLAYRRPVAYVQLGNGEQWLIDREATILPLEDVDDDHLGPLIKIVGRGLKPPADPVPGVVWKQGVPGAASPDRAILAAASTAAFLLDAQSGSSTPRIESIITSDFESRGLFLRTDRGVFVWWRSPPRQEENTEPTADQKWAMLTAWVNSKADPSVPDRDYIAFSRKGLYQICTHEQHPHRLPRPFPADPENEPH